VDLSVCSPMVQTRHHRSFRRPRTTCVHGRPDLGSQNPSLSPFQPHPEFTHTLDYSGLSPSELGSKSRPRSGPRHGRFRSRHRVRTHSAATHIQHLPFSPFHIPTMTSLRTLPKLPRVPTSHPLASSKPQLPHSPTHLLARRLGPPATQHATRVHMRQGAGRLLKSV
jgi:hypothetical protein